MRDYGIDELEFTHRVTGVCRAPGGAMIANYGDDDAGYPEAVEGGVYGVLQIGFEKLPRFVVMRGGRLHGLTETEAMDLVDPAGIEARRAALDARTYKEWEWRGPAPLGFTRTATGGRIVVRSHRNRHFWRQARPEEVAAWDAEHGAPTP
ncbi:hypothetical protein [Methylobacterium sp. J-067]|uniref:hypothetical protein n=1 Tax=Methylobacterium sp. J-067 TaxID=2836648 RepID=UPI001FB96A7F|nr:hypothetical protein [Methylobacterium sp. J-067]MCJ2023581.1 hypothetical protein [Methylobacterium sp. J-067]